MAAARAHPDRDFLAQMRIEARREGSELRIPGVQVAFGRNHFFGAKVARGLGLGLSIVDRIGRVLDHPVGVKSVVGRGSTAMNDSL